MLKLSSSGASVGDAGVSDAGVSDVGVGDVGCWHFRRPAQRILFWSVCFFSFSSVGVKDCVFRETVNV